MSKDNKFRTRFTNDSDSIGFTFMKTYSSWHNQIKNCLKTHKITHPQFIVLATLAYQSQFNEEITQVLLAGKTNIDVMTISQILENLEKKEYITRAVSARDSRAKSITLTQSGFDIVNKTVPLVEQIDQQFFAVLGNDQQVLNKILSTLLQK
ncbi:MarR family winged helix-turn-helix transcriptional regulator [Snodgrassella alvi]|uniref:MarR family winged helix-turn-helix transcriptional regulator n=1 Tax=Snodgrassella alvi TaxID=1196083 RepID=UPI002741B515|nr:MarR family winged helix-turn-helix transcriptional regulator [Snodgrassella alvi]WLT02279.1 MarR family winged helix-turn-helix transcriptional regulator [Snodgrassella alvi]